MGDILHEKAYEFAKRVVALSHFLHDTKHEYVLSRKILDAGTNIGLFIEEGKQGDSRDDFRAKYSLANKEAFKTKFSPSLSSRLRSDHRNAGRFHAVQMRGAPKAVDLDLEDPET